MISTILWPTDLSKNSLKAAKHVVSLAQKYQAKTIMLYVGTDLTSFWGGYAHEPGEHHLKNFQEWELKQAKSKMQTVCDTDLKACPNMVIKVAQGDAAAEILKMIQEEKVDLVVLTTHGRGQESLDQKSPVFGSVAEKVIRTSPAPVHLVNPYGT
ncbi:MAG: universal stress protein [Deltaproteobacteria bacterium]|nr:universal stress protein [Deltaproteobacteria bacterium]